MATAPIIYTERLILRGSILEDFARLRAFFDTPRAEFVGGNISTSQLWFGFAGDVGSWTLIGKGSWAITLKDGTNIGQVAVNQPAHFPEVEMGWILFEEFEGKGYAYEAAFAAREWARANMNLTSLVSYVAPKNHASAKLAQKLGAVIDPSAATPEGENDTLVYRHSLQSSLDSAGFQEAYA